MGKSTVIHHCTKWTKSDKCVKNGYVTIATEKGSTRIPRYKCLRCGKTFYTEIREKRQIADDSNQVKRLVLHLYMEGFSELEIPKMLKNYPPTQTLYDKNIEVEDIITETLASIPKAVSKYLNPLREKRSKISHYYHKHLKPIGECNYALFLQGCDGGTAYGLYMGIPGTKFDTHRMLRESSNEYTYVVETIDQLWDDLKKRHTLTSIIKEEVETLIKQNNFTPTKMVVLRDAVLKLQEEFNTNSDTAPHNWASNGDIYNSHYHRNRR